MIECIIQCIMHSVTMYFAKLVMYLNASSLMFEKKYQKFLECFFFVVEIFLLLKIFKQFFFIKKAHTTFQTIFDAISSNSTLSNKVQLVYRLLNKQ